MREFEIGEFAGEGFNVRVWYGGILAAGGEDGKD